MGKNGFAQIFCVHFPYYYVHIIFFGSLEGILLLGTWKCFKCMGKKRFLSCFVTAFVSWQGFKCVYGDSCLATVLYLPSPGNNSAVSMQIY